MSQGGKKEGTADEALAATSSNRGKKKHCKGNYHNCGKVGHWARKCHSTKKEKDESAATLATQMLSTIYKPENKPVGSANAIMAHDYEGDRFWMAEEEAINLAPIVSVEPDPMLGAPNDLEDAPHLEGEEMLLNKEEWFGAVITPAEETDSHICIKLYNSGAT